jgi:hypothetical protein
MMRPPAEILFGNPWRIHGGLVLDVCPPSRRRGRWPSC